MADTQGKKINDRLLLVRKALKLNQKDLAQKVGLARPYISELETGKKNVAKSTIYAYVEKLNVNREWLETGKGEIFLSDPETDHNSKGWAFNTSPAAIQIRPIPYFDIDASAGNGLVEMMGKINPDALLAVPGFRGADLAINVRGESMVPRYNPGDIIALKRILDMDAVNWGSCHVIVTAEQAFIKYLRYDEENPDTLILRSHNESYQDIRITKDKIRSLFVIKGKIERTEL